MEKCDIRSKGESALPLSPNSGNVRRRLSEAALVLFGCVLGLVLLELFLRVYDPFGQRIRLGQFHLATNLTQRITMHGAFGLDEVVVHTRNNIGLRGPDLPINRGKSLRILTVGGSTTECSYLSDDRTWPALLYAKLQHHFDSLWLNNAGFDGHSTWGHELFIRTLDKRIQPDLILFMVGLNDVPASWDPVTPTHTSPTLRESVRDVIKALGNYSEVVSLALNVQRALKAQERQLVHLPRALSDKNLLAVRLSPAEKARIVAEQVNPAAGYAARLANLINITRERHITPVLITQTALFGPTIDPTTRLDLSRLEIWGMDGATAWDVLEVYNDVTRHVAAEMGVPLIDLAHEMPKDSVYFYDEIHYTNAGARAVSEIVARHLCPIIVNKFPDFTVVSCT